MVIEAITTLLAGMYPPKLPQPKWKKVESPVEVFIRTKELADREFNKAANELECATTELANLVNEKGKTDKDAKS